MTGTLFDVLAIVAVSVQTANAANGQFRQLVVEPAGASANDALLKKNKNFKSFFILKSGQGIPKSVVTDGPVVTKANASGMQWMEDHFLI